MRGAGPLGAADAPDGSSSWLAASLLICLESPFSLLVVAPFALPMHKILCAADQHRRAVAITGVNPLAPVVIERSRCIKRWRSPRSW